ncbi:MAG: YkgJ family cysteine cluster protein [Phycisphaerales bacterium JB050]
MNTDRTGQEWFDEEPVRFECTLCGACCTGPSGFVLFSRAEGERIAQRLGITYEDFYERYTHDTPAGRSFRETPFVEPDGTVKHDCVFLDRETEPGKLVCSLYEDRPTQCRTFPFWPEHMGSRRTWRMLGKSCEGIGRGAFVPASEIRIQRAKQESSRQGHGRLEPDSHQ